MSNKQKILCTGGAGFIGSHLVEFLLNNNFHVRVLDNLSTGNKNNIGHLINNPNFEFIYGDITDLETCKKACSNIDIICHQAALGSVTRSVDDPLTSHNTNINGFLNILIAAKENKIKRIVYASSSSVYGDNQLLPKKESLIGRHLSPYAITKYVDELYAKIFTDIYGLECIGLRYFNVFGPRQNPNDQYSAVIPKFIYLLKQNKQPIIHGDGLQSRDFTYVDNVVLANYLALTTNNKECFGEVFNIGNASPVTVNSMLKTIKNILNKDIEPIFGPKRIGDILHSDADITKAKNMLGYKPITTFEEGIRKTINYLNN